MKKITTLLSLNLLIFVGSVAAQTCQVEEDAILKNCIDFAVGECRGDSSCADNKHVVTVTDITALAASKCCKKPNLKTQRACFLLEREKYNSDDARLLKPFFKEVRSTLAELAKGGCVAASPNPTATATRTPTVSPTPAAAMLGATTF